MAINQSWWWVGVKLSVIKIKPGVGAKNKPHLNQSLKDGHQYENQRERKLVDSSQNFKTMTPRPLAKKHVI